MPTLKTYQLFVEGYDLDLSIGVHDFERESKQKVIVDIMVDMQPLPPNASDDIEDVFSYQEITDYLEGLQESAHTDLVESLAVKIGAFCMRDQRVKRASVKISKPDIVSGCEGVGTRMVFEQGSI